MKHWFEDWISSPIKRFLSWRWVKHFIYWLIISAGTISECAFLLASLWMSINSSVHPMILTMMSEQKSVQISYVATTIFTALPELIVIMAVITTVNHCKNIRFQKRYWYTWLWAFLFGLPTVIFLTISLITVSCSVLKVSYVMPDWGIVARALAGYCFAVVYLLYEKLGEPCYADERKALEQTIVNLKAEMTQSKQHFETALQTANSHFQKLMESKQSDFDYQINSIIEQGKSKIESLQNLLEAKDMQVQKLSERASSLASQGLENYPKIVEDLIERQVKTVSFDELPALTGLSKQRLTRAKLQRHSRNRDLVIVSSLVEWLKTIPTNNTSNGHSEMEEDPFELPVLTVLE